MTAPRGTLRLIPSELNLGPRHAIGHAGLLPFEPPYAAESVDLGTFYADDLWGFPPFAWRLPAVALAVGVAAGWLLRGAR